MEVGYQKRRDKGKKKTQRSETGYGKAEYKLAFERREVWKQRTWEKVKYWSIAGEITHGVWEWKLAQEEIQNHLKIFVNIETNFCEESFIRHVNQTPQH